MDKARTNLGKNKVELLGPRVSGTPLASQSFLSEIFHQLRDCVLSLLTTREHKRVSEINSLDGHEAERMMVKSYPLTWRWMVSTALRILRRREEEREEVG